MALRPDAPNLVGSPLYSGIVEQFRQRALRQDQIGFRDDINLLSIKLKFFFKRQIHYYNFVQIKVIYIALIGQLQDPVYLHVVRVKVKFYFMIYHYLHQLPVKQFKHQRDQYTYIWHAVVMQLVLLKFGHYHVI